MNEIASNTPAKKDSTDTLLWLGVLIVAGVGASWLFLSQPWISEPATVTEVRSTARQPSPAAQAPAPEQESILDDPLRMARLAFEAGMLVEPENYSAWSLYEQILTDEPDHPEALQGLEDVADILAQRGVAALEQGRSEDSELIVDQILAVLPQHASAIQLADDLEAAAELAAAQAAAEAEEARIELALSTSVAAADLADVAEAEPIPVDPIPEYQAAFEEALAENRLLTPAEQSAKYFVGLMSTANSDDARAVESRRQLFERYMERAEDAVEAQDTQAATTWINEAELLGVNETAVAEARSALTERLIEMESLKRVPASALARLEYTPPAYPMRAVTRNIEGWVDLEFVVSADGTTREIEITDSSHDSYFRPEAVAAIEQWRFEPRIFMGQPIEQRSYTRTVFRLQ